MSPVLSPYLMFSGRCDEAIEFYQQAIGAHLEMVMRFSESPDPVPDGMLQPGFEDKVMHASLSVLGNRLMLSDGCDDKATFGGFSLSLSVDSAEQATSLFHALAVGGQVFMPIGKTFFSPCYGMLTDKFGVSWMVMVPGESPDGPAGS